MRALDVLLGEDTTTRRQFDNVTEEVRNGDPAGAADEFAGQIDESIGRQFDGQPGGGFADIDTYAAIVTGSNTEGTPDDVPGRVGDFVGRTTGTNPHEEGEPNPLGRVGRVIEWAFQHPALLGGGVLLLYLTPLLASALEVAAGVAAD